MLLPMRLLLRWSVLLLFGVFDNNDADGDVVCVVSVVRVVCSNVVVAFVCVVLVDCGGDGAVRVAVVVVVVWSCGWCA